MNPSFQFSTENFTISFDQTNKFVANQQKSHITIIWFHVGNKQLQGQLFMYALVQYTENSVPCNNYYLHGHLK